jgi:hypothetical protein
VDRNHFFFILVMMDGQRNGGSNGNGQWFGLDDCITNFKARLRDVDMGKMVHWHGDRMHVHRHCNKRGEEEEEEEEERRQRRCKDQP